MANKQTDNKSVFNGGVATWSVQTNTKHWNQALGIRYTRQGCSHTPSECMHFIAKVALQENVRITLHIPLNSSTTEADASEYSRLSLAAPYLVEVSVDDFVSQFRALFRNAIIQPATAVYKIIANLKSANHNLRFGATIYEDDLASPYLQNEKLPAGVRAKFDYVHLFIHYREDGPKFAGYVEQAKRLFPRARIVAGSYAYDRRAFLPCAPKGHACTPRQDIDLFKRSLAIQVQQLKGGTVDHIEFYPGYFGVEEQWPSWSNPRECASRDVGECITNTKAMRKAALKILGAGVGFH